MKAALYLRVSTGEQTVENQRRELEAVAQRHGWEVVEIFSDQGVSGATAQRPAFQRLLQGVARREFDLVAAWSVDRLGRSLPHLLEFLGELKAKGVDLFLLQQGLDTQTPAGKAMFQMCGVFAEFERAIIVERIRCGLARAKAAGVRIGRPRKPVDLNKAKVLMGQGKSLRETARAMQIPPSTLSAAVRNSSLPAAG